MLSHVIPPHNSGTRDVQYHKESLNIGNIPKEISLNLGLRVDDGKNNGVWLKKTEGVKYFFFHRLICSPGVQTLMQERPKAKYLAVTNTTKIFISKTVLRIWNHSSILKGIATIETLLWVCVHLTK